jgi:hemolysin activation/secretion protein
MTKRLSIDFNELPWFSQARSSDSLKGSVVRLTGCALVSVMAVLAMAADTPAGAQSAPPPFGSVPVPEFRFTGRLPPELRAPARPVATAGLPLPPGLTGVVTPDFRYTGLLPPELRAAPAAAAAIPALPLPPGLAGVVTPPFRYTGRLPPELRAAPAAAAAIPVLPLPPGLAGVVTPTFRYTGRLPPELRAAPAAAAAIPVLPLPPGLTGVVIPDFRYTGRLPPELRAAPATAAAIPVLPLPPGLTGVVTPDFAYTGRLPPELRAPPRATAAAPSLPLPPGVTGVITPEFVFTFAGVAAGESPDFEIQSIIVEGATALSEARIRQILSRFEGTVGSVDDLGAAAQAIEQAYQEAGFVISRAFVPPQEADDGRFVIQVLEGYVGSITMEGDDPAARRLVQTRIRPLLAQRPVTLAALERALLLANDLAGYNVTGTLRPGAEPGASDLVVAVQTTPFQGSASTNNRGTRTSGPHTVALDAAYSGLLGMGEQIGANISQTWELRESTSLGLRYTQPLDALGLGAEGVSLQLNAGYGFGRPGGDLRALNLVTGNTSFGARVVWPVIRSRARSITLDSGIAFTDSKTDALGQPLFRDASRTIDLRATWVELDLASLGGATSLILGATRGVGLLGARRKGDLEASRAEGDPDFWRFNAEVRHVQPLPFGLSLSLAGLFQRADRPLGSGEEFAVGGARIGRAFDAAEISGDNGYGGTFELRRTFIMDAGPFADVQLYGFYDIGSVSDLDRIRVRPRSLSSGGFGGRFTIDGGISGGLEWAIPVHRTDATLSTLRSHRIFFDLSARF